MRARGLRTTVGLISRPGATTCDALYSLRMDRNYLVVSPVRNEAEFIELTLKSVTSQTLRPLRWVIVDDGSTDKTRALAEEYASKHPWIEVVSRRDRGYRQSGIGVVETFYDGFARADSSQWDYVMKLDGDLLLPLDYLEQLTLEFERDPRLGISSGDIFNEAKGALTLDSPGDPAFHVRGAAKAYRRACWDAIGGIPRVTGFDCVDNVKARMLGWDTRRIPSLKVIHLRHTGEANGAWKNGFKDGLGANAIGYHPLFLLLKCFKRLFLGRCGIDALGQFCGYMTGYFTDVPRIQDRQLVEYLRRQQLNRLLGRETIWR